MTSDEAVLLVGHGRTATDTPREILAEFRILARGRKGTAETASPRERELEREIRHWPRTAENDPYKTGIEGIRAALGAALDGVRVEAAFNEFCAPTIEEAISTIAADGARSIAVVPTMFTPGGAHAERDIPEELERLRIRYPTVELRYAWPFPMPSIVRLLRDSLALNSEPRAC